MPSYNLTQTQVNILVTWLFEPHGYLEDGAIRVSDGLSARDALIADPNLDILQWIRDNTMVDPENADQVAMVWWIWKNDQVNITPPTRPPETASWVATLQTWDASINAGFARSPQNDRNSKNVQLYDENGDPAGTFPAGSHLAQQQQIISQVLGVLT